VRRPSRPGADLFGAAQDHQGGVRDGER
jgi:hypothetical protein